MSPTSTAIPFDVLMQYTVYIYQSGRQRDRTKCVRIRVRHSRKRFGRSLGIFTSRSLSFPKSVTLRGFAYIVLDAKCNRITTATALELSQTCCCVLLHCATYHCQFVVLLLLIFLYLSSIHSWPGTGTVDNRAVSPAIRPSVMSCLIHHASIGASCFSLWHKCPQYFLQSALLL